MKPSEPGCFLITCSGVHRLRVPLADRFFSRLRGLMLASPLHPEHGLLLVDCASIHTCFMRQTIDVLYLDRSGFVMKCVAGLAPWRFSSGSCRIGPGPRRSACHVLELPQGSIARLAIRPGSRLHHAYFTQEACASVPERPSGRLHLPVRSGMHERGSAMIEFAVVAPIITLLGLATIQYGLLFFAKNQYNHAAFMAARAGTIHNASMDEIQIAYARALIPLYGGGTTATALQASYAKARAAAQENATIEMLNPTTESFADFYDNDLQETVGSGVHRVIPNGGLAYKKATIVPAASGQNIQDANLLKLRITHGYAPQVPVVGAMYARYLKWLDAGARAADTEKINRGLIPVVTHVTLHMQSDAIEGATVSTPGMGNGGTPVDPGSAPPNRRNPPSCASVLCTTAAPDPGSSGGGKGGSNGGDDSGAPGDGPPAGPCVEAPV